LAFLLIPTLYLVVSLVATTTQNPPDELPKFLLNLPGIICFYAIFLSLPGLPGGLMTGNIAHQLNPKLSRRHSFTIALGWIVAVVIGGILGLLVPFVIIELLGYILGIAHATQRTFTTWEVGGMLAFGGAGIGGLGSLITVTVLRTFGASPKQRDTT
jgi:hypothetical protein